MKHSPFFILFLFILTMPVATSAAEPSVVIDTIQASGVTADDEFIDLLNPTDTTATLGTWSIQYKSSAGSTFYKKNFPSDATIAAQARYRIAGSGYTGTIVADMQQSTISLATAGGTVFLVGNQTLITDATDSDIVDQKIYTAPPTPQPDEPVPTPVPTSVPVVAPHQQPTYPRLTIDSFLADPPAGEKEWVLLMNDSGYAVDLTGWTIADGTGKTIAKPTGLILPRQTVKIELSTARLNNDGDQIILRDPSGKETDAKTYGDWNTDQETNLPKTAPQKIILPVEYEKIIARIVAEVINAMDATPAGERVVIQNLTVNIPSDAIRTATTNTPPPTKTTTLKKTAPKTVVSAIPTITGTVIVAPGVLWKDYAVLNTDAGSIQLHILKNTPPLVVGDTVSATGAWSKAQNLPLERLLPKAASALRVTGHNEPEGPMVVPLEEIKKHIGEIVETSGPIVERQQKRVRIAAGTESLIVPLESATDTRAGEIVTARGLIAHDGDNLKLFPLGTVSVSAAPTTDAPVSKTRRRITPYAIALAPAGILGTAVYIGRRRKKKGGDAHGRNQTENISG